MAPKKSVLDLEQLAKDGAIDPLAMGPGGSGGGGNGIGGGGGTQEAARPAVAQAAAVGAMAAASPEAKPLATTSRFPRSFQRLRQTLGAP